MSVLFLMLLGSGLTDDTNQVKSVISVLAPDGSYSVERVGEFPAVYIPEKSSSQILVYSPSGSVREIIRIPGLHLPIGWNKIGELELRDSTSANTRIRVNGTVNTDAIGGLDLYTVRHYGQYDFLASSRGTVLLDIFGRKTILSDLNKGDLAYVSQENVITAINDDYIFSVLTAPERSISLNSDADVKKSRLRFVDLSVQVRQSRAYRSIYELDASHCLTFVSTSHLFADAVVLSKSEEQDAGPPKEYTYLASVDIASGIVSPIARLMNLDEHEGESVYHSRIATYGNGNVVVRHADRIFFLQLRNRWIPSVVGERIRKPDMDKDLLGANKVFIADL
jgi:hypothetical protein